MPKINITISETSAAQEVQATDISVLVPLFVKDDGNSLDAKEYISADTFVSEFEDRVLTYSTSEATGVIMDDSYYFIYKLLAAGLYVVVKPVHSKLDNPTRDTLAADLCSQINGDTSNPSIYSEFTSRNLYDIKFITTGAHENLIATAGSEPTLSGCHEKLIEIVKSRGDCVALIELEENVVPDSYGDDIESKKQLQAIMSKYGPTNGTYASAFYPWCHYNFSTPDTIDEYFPACFGYLLAMADHYQTNNNDWFAIAGINRGELPISDGPEYNVTDSLAESMTAGDTTFSCRINPITMISGYGYRIWGNKTMDRSTANVNSYLTFLNVRMLVCDICKQIYKAAKVNTFEPNDNITWINFKGLVNNLLDTMVANRGIEWYSWKKLETSAKATISARLTIKPIEAVEDFVIEVVLTDNDASTEEV